MTKRMARLRVMDDELIKQYMEVYPDFNPLIRMAAVAEDETCSDELRFTAIREISRYLLAQRRAVEHSVADGGDVKLVVNTKGKK